MPTVLLAITSSGLNEALQVAAPLNGAVWCSADAVSEDDFQKLAGKSVTRFDYPLQGESLEVIGDAIGTIEEHHPGAIIWVEAPKSQP